MKDPNTITLIIGAGANKEIHNEIGLGRDLITDISNRVTDRTVKPRYAYLSKILNNDFSINLQMRENFLRHLDGYIHSNEYPSIDNFLKAVETGPEFISRREDFKRIIFVLTVAHIIGWEGTKTKGYIDREKVNRRTWLTVLGEYIEDHNLFETNALKIITFNYDRILEYYLWIKFGTRIKDFIKNNVHHVYGRIGNVEGLHPLKDGEKSIPLGLPDLPKEYIFAGTENIEFIHSDHPTNHVSGIILGSKQLIVFGYGMDPSNNKRLTLSEWAVQNDDGGNFKFHIHPNVKEKNRDMLASSVSELVDKADIVQGKTCRDFLAYSLRK